MVYTDGLDQNSVTQEHRAQVRKSEMSMARDLGQKSRKDDIKNCQGAGPMWPALWPLLNLVLQVEQT